MGEHTCNHRSGRRAGPEEQAWGSTQAHTGQGEEQAQERRPRGAHMHTQVREKSRPKNTKRGELARTDHKQIWHSCPPLSPPSSLAALAALASLALALTCCS